MSASSVTETRMINKHGSVEIPACLSQFNMPHLGVQISAVKACKHTGDTRTRVNTPEGSKKDDSRLVGGCSHSAQQQRVSQHTQT